MIVIRIRLTNANKSGVNDVWDSGEITLSRLPISHHEIGMPNKTANPMANKNSLLIRKAIFPNPAPSVFLMLIYFIFLANINKARPKMPEMEITIMMREAAPITCETWTNPLKYWSNTVSW